MVNALIVIIDNLSHLWHHSKAISAMSSASINALAYVSIIPTWAFFTAFIAKLDQLKPTLLMQRGQSIFAQLRLPIEKLLDEAHGPQ